MTKGAPSELEQARAFVEAWRDDDEELRIPGNEFGAELAHSIDVLLKATKPGLVTSILIDVPRCAACGQPGHNCPTGGRLLGGGPRVGGMLA